MKSTVLLSTLLFLLAASVSYAVQPAVNAKCAVAKATPTPGGKDGQKAPSEEKDKSKDKDKEEKPSGDPKDPPTDPGSDEPKNDKTKTTPEDRGMDGPPHNDEADVPAWGWGKDKKAKKTPVAPPKRPTPDPSLPTPHSTPTPPASPGQAEVKPVTVYIVVTATPVIVDGKPVTVVKPVTIIQVIRATPTRRTVIVRRRSPPPTPAPQVVRTGARVSVPCGNGWSFGLGASMGIDKRNDSLRRLWTQVTPEGLGWNGDAVNSSLDTDLLLRLGWFHLGGFFNWHFWSLGSAASATVGTGKVDFDLSLGALSYGVKFRLKPCGSPLMLDLSAGALSLSGARFTARDSQGLAQQVDLKGSAPFSRLEVGLDFAPASDASVYLTFGYQYALLSKMGYRVAVDRLDPASAGSTGTVVNDADGKDIRADFSGPRLGCGFIWRF